MQCELDSIRAGETSTRFPEARDYVCFPCFQKPLQQHLAVYGLYNRATKHLGQVFAPMLESVSTSF